MFQLFVVDLLMMTLGTAATGPSVLVRQLDGEQTTGQLVGWRDQQIELLVESPEGVQTVPLLHRKLLRIESPRPPQAFGISEWAGSRSVWLVEGTWLTVNDFWSTARQAELEGPAFLSHEASSLTLPLEQVHAVRLADPRGLPADLADTLAAEWQALLQRDTPNDLIVIHKPGAQTLKQVEGTLGEIGRDAVQFMLGGQTIDVTRDKVYGVIYYRGTPDDRDRRRQSSPAVVVEGKGFAIRAQQVRWQGGVWQVASEALGRQQILPDFVTAIDYSPGRVLYLSDLQPRRQKWTPPPRSVWKEPLFGGLAVDRGFYSPELQVEIPAADLRPEWVTSAGVPRRVTFRKGLALRSRMEVVYSLPAGYQTFRATAGMDPRTRKTGQVELRLFGDQQQLFAQTIAGDQAPVEMACPLGDARELTIVVDFGDQQPWDSSTGDNLHLGEARLTK